MEASGSGAAASDRVKAGAPPRLVAVQGTARPGAAAGRQPGRLVVFLGVADDASSRVAAALLAACSGGNGDQQAAPTTVPPTSTTTPPTSEDGGGSTTTFGPAASSAQFRRAR